MIIIVSPAKNMKPNKSHTSPISIPSFLKYTQNLIEELKTYTPWELQELMKINEKIALDSMERFQMMKFDGQGTSAIETYDGIQYKYMDILELSSKEREFLQDHLRILSGAYGVLKPYDSIYEYRLEMMTKFPNSTFKNLYNYWGNSLYEELTKKDRIIVNLASSEYSKCIVPFLTSKDTFITCTFKVYHKNTYKVLATAAKMARGRMVHYIAKNQISTLDGIKNFQDQNFHFSEKDSTKEEFVFLQEP